MWKRRQQTKPNDGPKLEDRKDDAASPPMKAPAPHVWNRPHDWLDEVIQEQQALGTFEDLPGQGKPLQLEERFDMAQHIMKGSNILPPWLELGQEIGREMGQVVAQLERGEGASSAIASVNQKIARYNRMCPSPLLQRPPVSQETIKEQWQRWQ